MNSCFKPRRRYWRPALIGLVVMTGAVGCSLQPDAAPRDVEGDVPPPEPASNEAAVGLDRVYFVEPGKDPLLQSVPRDAKTREDLIKILFGGPNSSEIAAQYQTSIPNGTELLSSRILGSTFYVETSEELGELTGDPLIRALAQIVYTASESDVIEAVNIKINGEARSWPTGTGQTKTGELRVYDFPAAVRSAQPAYPAQPVTG